MDKLNHLFWGGLILPAAHAVKRDKTLRFLRTIRDFPYKSREEKEEFQTESLKRLLSHCYYNVPYYRNVFERKGLTPDQFKTLQDLNKLPVLTKEMIYANRADFVATNISGGSLIKNATSGSTGPPLQIVYDADYLFRGEAGLHRLYEMCGYRLGENVLLFWSYPNNLLAVPAWQRELRQTIKRRYYLDTGIYGPDTFKNWIQIFRKKKPSVIYGYASAIFNFSQFLVDHAVELRGVKGVYTTAEKLYPHQRETISKAFNARVYDSYGCVEVLHLACECPQGMMHQTEDFSIIESEYNETLETEEFIVTSLFNYGFPILRYKNNDTGRLIEQNCSCGRGSNLLDLDIGRLYDNFSTPDGNILHATELTRLAFGCPGIIRFQYHQLSRDKIILKVVKASDFSAASQEHLDRIPKAISGRTSGLVDLEIEFVRDISVTSVGKYQYLKSDVKI